MPTGRAQREFVRRNERESLRWPQTEHGIHSEEKEIDPMENDDEKVSAMNNKLNPVAARLPRSARPTAKTPTITTWGHGRISPSATFLK